MDSKFILFLVHPGHGLPDLSHEHHAEHHRHPTTTGAIFWETVAEQFHENSGKQGLFGLRFLGHVINPFWLRNRYVEAKRKAANIRDYKMKKAQALHELEGTAHIGEGFNHFLNSLQPLAETIEKRMERITTGNATELDKADALKSHGIATRLSPEQMKFFVDFVKLGKTLLREQKELGTLSLRKNDPRITDKFEKAHVAQAFEQMQHIFNEGAEKFAAALSGPHSTIIMLGVAEALAIKDLAARAKK
ncbi:MAG TPA: hypothetical protein VJG83_00645 [archaeon]|nr:hypothetical protein [archaeon]